MVWLHRVSHIAVTWKEATLIWGGRVKDEFCDPSVVSCHFAGGWIQKKTRGDVPTHFLNSVAAVFNDRMFVLGGIDKHEDHIDGNVIHFLDLNTWMWTRLVPDGNPPAEQSMSNNTWVYEGNIYTFGSYSQNLEIFCYNISTNHWSKPTARGDIPCHRQGEKVIVNEGTVFLFGGYTIDHHRNDLYMLDMHKLRWKIIHGVMKDIASYGVVPSARSAHSMTCISQSAAVVYGGVIEATMMGIQQFLVLQDCWILNLDKAKDLQKPSLIWTRIKQTELNSRARGLAGRRYCHAAVLEPASLRLWLIGGAGSSQGLCMISFNVLPMRLCAIESIVDCIKGDDPRLRPGECPEQLRKEIEAYRTGTEEE